jgi:hypothetical protein
MKYLKKGLAYLVNYSASTLFVYCLFNIGMYFYRPSYSVEPKALLTGIYLQIIYAVLALTVLLIVELRFLKSEDEQEQLIYGVLNVVFYTVILALCIVLLVLSFQKNAILLGALAFLLLAFDLIHLGYGICLIVTRKNAGAKETIAPVKEDETPKDHE